MGSPRMPLAPLPVPSVSFFNDVSLVSFNTAVELGYQAPYFPCKRGLLALCVCDTEEEPHPSIRLVSKLQVNTVERCVWY